MAEVKPQLEEMMRQRKLAEYQQKILKEANIK
jgi:peptidyl-prolyl cis-trans isomerase C